MRKSKVNVDQVTSEIIDVAIDIFSQKGYEATNLQDVADAVGISRTPLYYHFKNKASLYEQATARYMQEMVQQYERVFGGDGDIFDKIRNDLLLCTQQGLTEQTLFTDLADDPDDPALKNVQKMREQTAESIYQIKYKAVTAAIRKGTLRADLDIDEFVNHLYILYYGFVGMSKARFHSTSMVDNRKLMDTVVQGMILKYGTKKYD